MKLSLDETWKRCLEMWEWVVEESHYENGSYPYDIDYLKGIWLKRHYPKDDLTNDCYFCNYKDAFEKGCKCCPGKLVDSFFNCMNHQYDYYHNPREFLKKLKELNKKRLRAKQTPLGQ